MPSAKERWVSKRCDALVDQATGKRCRAWAIRGAERCARHGAGTKAARAKAAKVILTTALEKAAITYGAARDISPAEAFDEELARTQGHIDWLGERIRETEKGELIWGVLERAERTGWGDENNWSEEKVGAVAHAWLQLYMKERAHLVSVANMMVRNGLEARRIEISQQVVDKLDMAIQGILTDLNIDLTDGRVRSVVAARLMEASHLEPLAIAVPSSRVGAGR